MHRRFSLRTEIPTGAWHGTDTNISPFCDVKNRLFEVIVLFCLTSIRGMEKMYSRWDDQQADSSERRECHCTRTRRYRPHTPRYRRSRQCIQSSLFMSDICMQIEIRNGQVFLVDVRSTNGTLLNGLVLLWS